jgi:hypothetical protein
VAGVVKAKSEGLDLVLVVTVSDGHFNDKWVLNIACTFHMSHKRD